MFRIALVYGVISGAIIIGVMTLGIATSGGESHGASSQWFGYLIMLIALSAIFLGIRRYRNVERGGVIKFLPAFGLGLAIAFAASLIYIAGWEMYLAATGHEFIETYVAASIEAKREDGATAEEMAAFIERMEQMETMYGNPLYRVPITFTEIFPVGLIVALISAAVLRKPGFSLPFRK